MLAVSGRNRCLMGEAITSAVSASILLASTVPVFVQSTDDDSDPGASMTLGEYARQVFEVFGDYEVDEYVLEGLWQVAAGKHEVVEIGPDQVFLEEMTEVES